MHRIDFVLASNLRFLAIGLNCNKVLLVVKQSVSTIVHSTRVYGTSKLYQRY